MFPHIIKGDQDFEVPECHLDLISFLSSPESGAAIFPRGHAKSTWEKIDTIHDIVYALEPVVMYISNSLDDAQFHFESIKFELETNERLRRIYGDLVPDLKSPSVKWTNKHFETTNQVNVVARGAGKGRGVNIKNQRPTKIIVDDAETDEQVHSDMRRRKYHDWLHNVVMPSLDKDRGKIKVIGTVIHPEVEVLKFYNEQGGIFRRIIEDGKSIWWSMEEIIKIRDGFTDSKGVFHAGIGTRAFMQEYMNEPINDDTAIFKREWLDVNTWEIMPSRDKMEIKMAVDPNAGQSRMADFMGVSVIGRHKSTKKRYVLEALKFKGSLMEQKEFFIRIYKKWNPMIAGIEVVLSQNALWQLISAEGDYRITKLSPESKDKVTRAQAVQPLVEQGVILFHPGQIELYNEMIQFPNGAHDDMVDAFVYCNSLFSTNSVSLNTTPSPMATAGLRTMKF